MLSIIRVLISRAQILLEKTKNIQNKLTTAITLEIIIKIPAILFTHLSPANSNFFLKSVTPELSNRNHKLEPIKTPATRADAEKELSPFPKPSAANIPIKTKIVIGLVRVRKIVVKYDLKIPLPWI